MVKPLTIEMLNKAFSSIFELKKKAISKVLVVEDNKTENHAIVELLSAHHIQSDSAYTGTEAFEKIQKAEVDCIILDLNLPDMGGYELMEKIRSSEKFSRLAIIIYSGKDLSEEEERKLKKYANTIIIKNQFSYIRLLDEVQLFLKSVSEKIYGNDSFKMKLHIPEKLLENKKVLIVDDDVRNVYSLYSVLENQNMQILIANDGKEALEKMENEKDIDIVLMDIMMPVMDGIEAIKAARKNPSLKNLPIIALTAKAMKGDREKCLQAGATDYLFKPIDTQKLLALMRVLLYDI
jgi:CheY-like chemotaxis protein